MTDSPDTMPVATMNVRDLAAVELAEIDEALQPLSHRRQIVHAAEHERIDRRRAWIEMAVTAREKGTNRTGPEGHAAPGPGPMVPLRGEISKKARALDS